MIKGINLIPDEVRRERFLRKRRNALIAAAAVCLVLLALIYMNRRFAVNYKSMETAGTSAAADESLSYTGVLPADRDEKLLR